jgi:hypothetical protein
VNPSRYTTSSPSLGSSISLTALYSIGAYISDFFADLRTRLGATGTPSFAGIFADLFALTFGAEGGVPSAYYMGNVVAFFAITFISFGGSICILSIFIYMRNI